MQLRNGKLILTESQPLWRPFMEKNEYLSETKGYPWEWSKITNNMLDKNEWTIDRCCAFVEHLTYTSDEWMTILINEEQSLSPSKEIMQYGHRLLEIVACFNEQSQRAISAPLTRGHAERMDGAWEYLYEIGNLSIEISENWQEKINMQ
jgi:hypothetical protein